MRRAGYILVETIVSMGLLSIGMVAIQGGIRQAIITRGQAQDFTTARFLMEQVAGEKQIQIELVESKGEGHFEGDLSRFAYEWEISKVEIPKPEITGEVPPEMRQRLEQEFKGYMGKLRVRIRWTRAGMPFEAVGETLLKPEQLWQPPVKPL